MPVQKVIDNYSSEIISLNKQVSSLGTLRDELQIKINQFIAPVAQLDLIVSNLTVSINRKIYDISVLANNANACGCGLTATRTDNIYNSFGDIIGVTTTTYTVGDYYYYEQVKAHRINAEDTTYSGTNPFGPYSGTDGSVTFTTGSGYGTTINGINSDSITGLTITNPGSGYTAGTYYRQSLTGGTGSGALADVVVGVAGTITSIIVNNGGNGYQTNQSVGITSFPGAIFNIASVGSPILGYGVDTYIVTSSGVGSVFVPVIASGNVSICSTSCATYASQFTALANDLTALRSTRDGLLSGINILKTESKRLYSQRYGFVYSGENLNKRKTTVNTIINTLSNSTYNSYFV